MVMVHLLRMRLPASVPSLRCCYEALAMALTALLAMYPFRGFLCTPITALAKDPLQQSFTRMDTRWGPTVDIHFRIQVRIP